MQRKYLKLQRVKVKIAMLNVTNLNVGYGSFQALFNIDIDVKAGEAVAVIGPNGAGKTTLMRAISGLMPVKSGNIDMEGTEVTKTPAHDIVKLGIAHVPEHRRLFPRMSVEDNLRMGSYAPQFRANYHKRLILYIHYFHECKKEEIN